MAVAVEILLSTYNGSAYLDELLSSLLQQDFTNFTVRIRDDGSTDSTLDIIAKYNAKLTIKVTAGSNLGAAKSFFELLEHADANAGFYAFCDQDDVWLPQKLSRAVACLQQEDSSQALLYCSRQWITDKALQVNRLSELPGRPLQLGNALIENVVTGCTVVINQQARQLLVGRIIPADDIIMHDWWFYIVISALGKVIFDQQACILYRQHGANTIGANQGIVRWLARIKRFMVGNSQHKLELQAFCFLQRYADELDAMTKQRIKLVFGGYQVCFQKCKVLFWEKWVYRQRALDSFYIRIMLLVKN
ncbi:MAG: glycosyltransferase family 2 protein [Methylococcaceae bacterium]|jgi:glycosyltransferase involved in cell wall biosynthesis